MSRCTSGDKEVNDILGCPDLGMLDTSNTLVAKSGTMQQVKSLKLDDYVPLLYTGSLNTNVSLNKIFNHNTVYTKPAVHNN